MGKFFEMPKAHRVATYQERMSSPRRGVMSENAQNCLMRVLPNEVVQLYDPKSTPAQKGSARFAVINILFMALGEACVWRQRVERSFRGGRLIWEPNKRTPKAKDERAQ